MFVGGLFKTSASDGNRIKETHRNLTNSSNRSPRQGSSTAFLQWATPGQDLDNFGPSSDMTDAAVEGGKHRCGPRRRLLTLNDLCELQTLPLRVAASRAQLSETQVRPARPLNP